MSEVHDIGSSSAERLYRLQTDPTNRWRAAVFAGGLGALLATVHWSGLLLGGALVGLAWPTLRRAVVAGLGFGVVVAGVFVVEIAIAGSLSSVLGMGVIGAIPVLVPLVAGPLGATVRGLVPDVPE